MFSSQLEDMQKEHRTATKTMNVKINVLTKSVKDLNIRVSHLEEREKIVHALHKREVVDRIRRALCAHFGSPATAVASDGRVVLDWGGFFNKVSSADFEAWATSKFPSLSTPAGAYEEVVNGAADGNDVAHKEVEKNLVSVALSVRNLSSAPLTYLFYCAQMKAFGNIRQF